jgi:hypothetical protein
MIQPEPQRKFLSGWRRWITIACAVGLLIVLAFSLALWRQATIAKDCHQATPLPTDVRLVAPGAEAPEMMALSTAPPSDRGARSPLAT